MVYLVIDTINYEDLDAQKDELTALEHKLRGLENELLVNQKTIDQIKDTIHDLRKEQAVMREESKAVRAKGKSTVNKTFASIHRSDFEFARQKPLQCDIRMSDVYEKLPFDNPVRSQQTYRIQTRNLYQLSLLCRMVVFGSKAGILLMTSRNGIQTKSSKYL